MRRGVSMMDVCFVWDGKNRKRVEKKKGERKGGK